MRDGERLATAAGPPTSGARRGSRRTLREAWDRLSPRQRVVLRGAAAGLVASAVTGLVDRATDPLIGEETRRRERRVREGSPHDVAGPRAARRLLGRRLGPLEKVGAQGAFAVLYAIGWGVIHALVREKVPAAQRYGGLPFAVPFFAACDGGIAPLLGLTPGLHRVPWQLDLKELGNHVVWTAAAEAVWRAGSEARR